MSAKVGVVVPAAGLGRRMGGVKKAFLALDGVPVLLRALRPFLDRDDVVCVTVALAPDDASNPPEWLVSADPRVRVVAGGATRAHSVRAGLDALPPEADAVLVHDGARPLVTAEAIGRCIAAVAAGTGAVVGVPAVDTMKEVDAAVRVVGTPNRSRLWHAQTPQGFPRAMAEDAYSEPSRYAVATDDASLAELAGHEVVMVEGDRWNLKVTKPEDVGIAEVILRSRRP